MLVEVTGNTAIILKEMLDRLPHLYSVERDFAPYFLAEPVAVTTITDLDALEISVTVGGTEPITYQWQAITTEGGLWEDILGETNKVFSVASADYANYNGNSYRCVVSNDLATVRSNPGVVEVIPVAPIIITQPVAQTVAEGGTATFSVDAYGTGDLLYQWQRLPVLGSDWENISGATNASYTTEVLSYMLHDGDAFRCLIGNEFGETISDNALLTVTTDVTYGFLFNVGDGADDWSIHQQNGGVTLDLDVYSNHIGITLESWSELNPDLSSELWLEYKLWAGQDLSSYSHVGIVWGREDFSNQKDKGQFRFYVGEDGGTELVTFEVLGGGEWAPKIDLIDITSLGVERANASIDFETLDEGHSSADPDYKSTVKIYRIYLVPA